MDGTPKKLLSRQNAKKSPKSPKFMKPSEVFKMRKKKRMCGSMCGSPSSKSPLKAIYSPLKCLRTTPNKELSLKLFSPFKTKRTPNKRNKCRVSAKKSPIGKRQLNFVCHEKRDVWRAVNVDDENANLEAANGVPFTDADRQTPQSLIDWTLKTRLRFTSFTPFPLRANFRATEEATGISNFVRCYGNDCATDGSDANNTTNVTNNLMDSSFASLLHKHCLVWSHPNLPWLTLFPRNSGHSTPGTPMAFKAPTFSIMPSTPLADALHSDWCLSLKSVYQLLKVKQCPYFYVCANTFTALFRASGVAACDDIQVLVTPTTTGLRKLISQDSIPFSMPFHDDRQLVDDSAVADICMNTEPALASHDDNNEEESIQWLESLGLSQQDFPSLQTKRKNKSSAVNAVSRRKSLILIKGMSNTQLFINFLINARVCIASTGPLSGVPPTLLSPVAFRGSTLQSLKLKHTNNNQSGSDSHHSLEISGPLLPNAVIGLINLFKKYHKCFKGLFNTYEQTIPFASCTANTSDTVSTSLAFAKENLKDCGLENEFLHFICSDQHQSTHSINEIVCNNSNVVYMDKIKF